MTYVEDALNSLNKELNDIFVDYENKCLSRKKAFEDDVEIERDRLSNELKIYNHLLDEYNELNEMAQAGAYRGHAERIYNSDLESRLQPTANPQESIKYLRADIEELSERHPKIDEAVARLIPNYKIVLSERVHIGLRTIRLYLDENRIDVDDALDDYRRRISLNMESELEDFRKSCVTDMERSIKACNEMIGKEIIRLAKSAKS